MAKILHYFFNKIKKSYSIFIIWSVFNRARTRTIRQRKTGNQASRLTPPLKIWAFMLW